MSEILEDTFKQLSNIDDEWLDKTLIELLQPLIEKARDDFSLFFELCFKDNHNKFLRLSDFQREIIDNILNNDWKYIEVPRGHGKTTIVIAYILWKIGKNPNIRVKVVCNRDDTARARIKAIEEHIETNILYRLVFPNIIPRKGRWAKHTFQVHRDFVSPDDTCTGYGIFSSGVGGRSELLVFDDIVDERNTLINPADIQKVIQLFNNTWMKTQQAPKAEVIVVNTPWHEADLTQILKTNKEFSQSLFSIDENFEPLWPEIYTKEDHIRDYEFDPPSFERAFRCKPVASTDRYFLPGWLEQCFDAKFKINDLLSSTEYLIGIDLASGESGESAFSVFFIIAILPDGRKVVINILRGRMDFRTLVETTLELNGKYNPEMIVIEDNAFQRSLINQLLHEQRIRLIPKLNILPFTTSKENKKPGLRELAVEFNQKQWIIPYDERKHIGDKTTTSNRLECECNICVWLNEIRSYPFGKFSDTVMACWFASIPAKNLTIYHTEDRKEEYAEVNNSDIDVETMYDFYEDAEGSDKEFNIA